MAAFGNVCRLFYSQFKEKKLCYLHSFLAQKNVGTKPLTKYLSRRNYHWVTDGVKCYFLSEERERMYGSHRWKTHT